MSMSERSSACDVVIIGGGVAGLWARHALTAAGYSVVLLERGRLGAGQTAASQGILHAGFKYSITEASQKISEDLQRNREEWHRSLAGVGGPDLRRVRILASTMHFWSVGMLARAAGVAAGSVMRSGVRALGRMEFPACFADAPSSVSAWEVSEKSVDPASLARELAASAQGAIVSPVAVRRIDAETGTVVATDGAGRTLRVRGQRVLLAAGEGSGALLTLAGIDSVRVMQTRPLHQVLVRPAPFSLFAHCMQPRPKPRITVTTMESLRGERVWYLGGDVAETGVARSAAEQVAFARAELRECIPWVDLSAAQFATLRVNRAEARLSGNQRPIGPELREFGRLIAVWPTKLAMAPSAADAVLKNLRAAGVRPGAVQENDLPSYEPPDCEPPPCDSPSLAWS